MGDKTDYQDQLEALQLGLVRTQQYAIEKGRKIVVLLEGRDGAGKDGAIARMIEHLGARYTRAVSLPKPSDRQKSEWWFQRYVRHLPAAGEFVIFNRSWYNRAGVEPVMGFCTPAEHEAFLREAPSFEAMLVESGVHLAKFWLDISKAEQAERLEDRRKDPLKALKTSPMDAEAQKRWKDYSAARDLMLSRTHTALAPWTVIHTDDKKLARLNLMRSLLHKVAPAEITDKIDAADPKIAYEFEDEALTDGRLEA
jgi:polyphosphate kinase 2